MATRGQYIYEWPRPMVTVDSLVFTDSPEGLRVLLVQRGREPRRGYWSTPGGFLELDEELSVGAARELAEETGLLNIPLFQFHTFGNLGRDPRGRVITVMYVGYVPWEQAHATPGDDAAQAQWFAPEALPKDTILDHEHVISAGWDFLQQQDLGTHPC